MNFVIYRYISPSGKSYVGQTNNFLRRARAHKLRASGCAAFASAIEKHGWDNFQCEILVDGVSAEEANELETRYIQLYNSLAPNGYNLMTGGKAPIASSITRARISANRTGKGKGFSRIPSEDERARISAALRGRKLSDAHRTNISAGQLGHKRNLGKIHSEDSRKKASVANMGHAVSAETRRRIAAAQKGVAKRAVSVNANGEVQPVCKTGHFVVGENARTLASGRLACRVCDREAQRSRRTSKKATSAATITEGNS